MAFDVSNFVIDRVVRGVALSQTDDSVMFSVNQITDPTLTCASESNDAVDALGTPIATFYRSKSAEFSAANALYDMNLMAVQVGSEKKVASAQDKILAPAFETVTIVADQATYTLAHTPKTDPKYVYLLNGDSSLGTVYEKANSSSTTAFAISGATLTPPTGLQPGDQLFVIYDYDATAAVSVSDSATAFPTACKFILEILGCDVCDQTKLIYAYLVFPNFKISPDFDWNITTDGNHPFSGTAQQEYCGKDNLLFQIIIPGEEE